MDKLRNQDNFPLMINIFSAESVDVILQLYFKHSSYYDFTVYIEIVLEHNEDQTGSFLNFYGL